MILRMPPSDNLPLCGVRVLITRPEEDSVVERSLLEESGATVYSLPTIAIRPALDDAAVSAIADGLSSFDWLAFTSRNAVRTFLPRVRALALQGLLPRIAAVGDSTARELRRLGYEPDVVGDGTGARSLASALARHGVQSQRVLLLNGNLATDDFSTELQRAGALITRVPVYETVNPETYDDDRLQRLIDGDIDLVVLASPSAFVNLMSLRPNEMSTAMRATRLVCIGQTTASAVRSEGYEPAAVAQHPNPQSQIDAIASLFRVEQKI